MPFGKKYTYNPVPARLGMLLVAAPNTGKSTMVSQMLKDTDKLGIVVDADGRFDEVVSEQTQNFFPLSDDAHEMVDPKLIHDAVFREMPNKNVGLFVVDSVTAILEPIILEIQRNVEEGKEKGARGYKAKSDAMKYLQSALVRWGTDVIWVYHYRDRGNAQGKKETVESITDLELSRLWRNINIKCEIVLDEHGTRGLRVLYARGGRSGFIIWDDSGTWENIRTKLEEQVWGGLTKEEQAELIDKNSFSSPAEAIAWAMEISEQYGNFFADEQHAKNSAKKLQDELVASGEEFTLEDFYNAWREKVQRKALEHE